VLNLEQLKSRIEAAFPSARLEVVKNPGAPGQDSLLLSDPARAREIAAWLRDQPDLRFDYASNVTGIDWPARTVVEKHREKQVIDGVEREIERATERTIPGCLEVVYHLYSMQLKHGPLILRMRTRDRAEGVHLPSLTPVWRGAEFQEREVYDLYGVIFDGHPDLRRILMWDEFRDYPMRKDYVEPDDFEYEPTPHGEVLERARPHYRKPE